MLLSLPFFLIVSGHPSVPAVGYVGALLGAIQIAVVGIVIALANIGAAVGDGSPIVILPSFVLALVCMAVYRWLLGGAAKMLSRVA
jgi:hypothetical protein